MPIGFAHGLANGGFHLRLLLEILSDGYGGPVQCFADRQIGVRLELATGLGTASRLAQHIIPKEPDNAVRDFGRVFRLLLILLGFCLRRLGAESLPDLGFGPLGLAAPRLLGANHSQCRADHTADQQQEDDRGRQHGPAVPSQGFPQTVSR